MLVGIAAGGTTPYVLGGLEHARAIGALAIALACVPSDQVPMPCDIDIRLLTGAELVTGSTRLKAGTATKMALNLLSTGVMVRLGKVHGNRMVDVAVTNAKLEDRALRILRDLAGVPPERGGVLLAEAGGSVKLALLMAATGLAAPQARAALDRHGPSLRDGLRALGASLPGPGQSVAPDRGFAGAPVGLVNSSVRRRVAGGTCSGGVIRAYRRARWALLAGRVAATLSAVARMICWARVALALRLSSTSSTVTAS